MKALNFTLCAFCKKVPLLSSEYKEQSILFESKAVCVTCAKQLVVDHHREIELRADGKIRNLYHVVSWNAPKNTKTICGLDIPEILQKLLSSKQAEQREKRVIQIMHEAGEDIQECPDCKSLMGDQP